MASGTRSPSEAPPVDYSYKIAGEPIKASRCDVIDILGAVAVIALVSATVLAVLNMTGTLNVSSWMTTHIGSNAANIAMISTAAFGALALIAALVSRASQGSRASDYKVTLQESQFDAETTAYMLAAQLNTREMADAIANRVEAQLKKEPRYVAQNDLHIHSSQSGAGQIVAGSVSDAIRELRTQFDSAQAEMRSTIENLDTSIPASDIAALDQKLGELRAKVDEIQDGLEADRAGDVEEGDEAGDAEEGDEAGGAEEAGAGVEADPPAAGAGAGGKAPKGEAAKREAAAEV